MKDEALLRSMLGDLLLILAHIVHNFAGANNLIPMEIALKIASKIKANERFAVYIIIPMWPEGVPTGAATQRILFWQVYLNSSYQKQNVLKKDSIAMNFFTSKVNS